MKKLMEHKGKLFWSSLLVLLPVPVVWALQGKVLIAPFLFLALHWVALLITFHNNKEKNQGKKAIGMVFFLVPMLSLLTAVAFCLLRSGRSQWIPTIMSLGFGVLFVVVGNYLPKVRKNETLGIRVPWAMWDEENWNATHRFGGPGVGDRRLPLPRLRPDARRRNTDADFHRGDPHCGRRSLPLLLSLL